MNDHTSTPRTRAYRENQDMKGLKRLTFYTTAKLKEDLDAVAKAEFRSTSKQIEKIICDWSAKR